MPRFKIKAYGFKRVQARCSSIHFWRLFFFAESSSDCWTWAKNELRCEICCFSPLQKLMSAFADTTYKDIHMRYSFVPLFFETIVRSERANALFIVDMTLFVTSNLWPRHQRKENLTVFLTVCATQLHTEPYSSRTKQSCGHKDNTSHVYASMPCIVDVLICLPIYKIKMRKGSFHIYEVAQHYRWANTVVVILFYWMERPIRRMLCSSSRNIRIDFCPTIQAARY